MPMQRALAVYVAGKVVGYARHILNIHEDKLLCLDCKLLPTQPVSGRCGHTRCTKCIQENGACPCGVPEPDVLHKNILVQDLIEKIISKLQITRLRTPSHTSALLTSPESGNSLLPSTSSGRVRGFTLRSHPYRKRDKMHSTLTGPKEFSVRRILASPQMRYEYARQLFSSGRCYEAAAHLAHVAASSEATAKLAHELLTQVITTLSSGDPRGLTRSLYQCVRRQSLMECMNPADIECPVCYDVMEQPVTTPCGHTFCRQCIKRVMLTRKVCPLCSSSITDFYLAQTENTQLLCAALGTITEEPQINADIIPIFACTVAFPGIPCPVMIFNTDFMNVVRELLDSGYRRFGMLPSLDDVNDQSYGTILEIRDCVIFEDGRSIVTTVGVSRFLVQEKFAINGCPFARIQEHIDIVPVTEIDILELQLLAQQLSSKIQQWLSTLSVAMQMYIVTSFGPYPEMDLEEEWWNNPNGPYWMWWLIAVLPLKSEIQMLMLQTDYLSKRMAAAIRTLDRIEFCAKLWGTMS